MIRYKNITKEYEGKPVVVYMDKHVLTGVLTAWQDTYVVVDSAGPDDPRNPFAGFEGVRIHIDWENVVAISGPFGEKPMIERVKPSPLIKV